MSASCRSGHAHAVTEVETGGSTRRDATPPWRGRGPWVRAFGQKSRCPKVLPAELRCQDAINLATLAFAAGSSVPPVHIECNLTPNSHACPRCPYDETGYQAAEGRRRLAKAHGRYATMPDLPKSPARRGASLCAMPRRCPLATRVALTLCAASMPPAPRFFPGNFGW